MRLILASTSERRKKIFSLLGLPFEVIPPNFQETLQPSKSLEDEVQAFSLGKAQSLTHESPDSIIIGSDTMILLEGEKIGKPNDLHHAKRILQTLSGKTHQILTGLAIINSKTEETFKVLERAEVTLHHLSDVEISQYISIGESLDKAGAYSLQGEGRELIVSLRGDYLAAVGLPLKPIGSYLQTAGISFPLDIKRLYSEKSFMNWKSF